MSGNGSECKPLPGTGSEGGSAGAHGGEGVRRSGCDGPGGVSGGGDEDGGGGGGGGATSAEGGGGAAGCGGGVDDVAPRDGGGGGGCCCCCCCLDPLDSALSAPRSPLM